ncbi:hypothetical protein COT42_03515 [Candidatus Saganbacteria bacterium CG08_land_8_20_14_0_20_45_16]|uniref:Uncharacterized protein n=1 Tax=Candidatus Saganbacteria bacterium CG08_land_8_20_14_0_20_45_16 TaxID=2014293 RepID=A0A2H0Y144_UNCSA|nr:MAG: hypothetical protein COT42_03515 [Candidatus Saganbacteria bacterium CG08_land_8_20_14_0_20_45_16]
MVIGRIDQTKKSEVEPATLKKGLPGKLAKKKPCVYYPAVECLLLQFKFRLCQSCRRAAPYVKKDEVKNIFEYIKSRAISLKKHFG